MGLISRLLGRRRPTFDAPAAPDPARLEEARREADRSGEVLDQVKAHDRRVTETSERAARALRQNHLGPSFWAWAESLGDRRSP